VPADEVSIIQTFAPDLDSASGRFYAWAMPAPPETSSLVMSTLDSLWRRWHPLSTFLGLNVDAPPMGPASVLVAVSPRPSNVLLERAREVSVMPFSELAPYIPAWEAGASVLMKVKDMPAPLSVRAERSPIEWSLNVPIFAEDVWVGLIGCVTGPEGVSTRAMSAFEAASRLLSSEYEAFRHTSDRASVFDDNAFRAPPT